ncbi:MAG: hypothetical protein QM619_03670 [Micropruina sp.]|uniref:hypothetical protein n=1 Tax=Micropruina sp. TaxID=2737536 RepID=UPI0039E6B577
MDHDSQRVAQLIAAADPHPQQDDGDTLALVWSRIEPELHEPATPVPLRRGRRWAITGAVVTAVAALTAAAPFIATRTGVWNAPEYVSVGGPGEEYRLQGTDFASELAALGADIPYPDQASRDAVRQHMIADLTEGTEPASATTGALRTDLAKGSICAWMRTWTTATEAGRRADSAAALAALRGAPSWTAVTDVDPRPRIDGEVDAGTGVRNPTVFGYLPAIIKAAESNDRAGLAELAEASAYCVYYDDQPTAPAQAAPPAAETPSSAAPTEPGVQTGGGHR